MNVTIHAVAPFPDARLRSYACKMTTKHALTNETTVSFVLSSGGMAVWTGVEELMRTLYHNLYLRHP